MIKGLTIALLSSIHVAAGTVTVVSWNVESGGARISSLTAKMGEMPPADIWGFSEVRGEDWATAFEQAAETSSGNSFSSRLGTTGGSDRMLIVFNDAKFELVASSELHWINTGGAVRAPLVAQLKEKSSGAEFLFMVNHLYRSRAAARHQQSSQLNEWASQQTLPIVTVGDFNYDWEVEGGDVNHDEGFDILTAGGVFSWVRPQTPLVATQSSSYNSVLDFVFLSHAASGWTATSTIYKVEGDFPDNDTTSDHRPVIAKFELPAGVTPAQGGAIAKSAFNLKPFSGEGAKNAEIEADGLEDVPDADDSVLPGFSGASPALAGNQYGRFRGKVVTEWLKEEGADDRKMKLLEDFTYTDPRGKVWKAPAGWSIDGASIPPVFWNKYIGPPFVGDYRWASVVHDVACDTKTSPHREVHRMFYDACRTGGVGETKAKMMYWAVRTFGPKWDSAGPSRMAARPGTVGIEELADSFEVRDVLLSNENLSIDQLESMLDAAEEADVSAE